MTDYGDPIGLELIREIAAQDMIRATPKRDAQGYVIPGAFTFKWAANADEQLEGHLFHILRGRNLSIQPLKRTALPNHPNGPTKSTYVE